MPAQPATLSVTAVHRLLGDTLADLGALSVRGEISSLTIARSGHAYITLRDRDATLNVTMWRSAVVRHSPFPKEGDQVVCKGRLETYAPRGSLSLIASSIKAAGAGDLAQQLAALQAQLTAEGLFEEERKQALPALPRAVGLATAAGSAALADMLSGLVERFASMPVVFEDCQVQGAGAAASIVQAIRALDENPLVDVIIVGRGGGSLEDLWAFNEEPVVRAIAACSTPIIAAVGHETDHSLADLAADLRAKTPTMAAELAVPMWHDLVEELQWRQLQLRRSLQRRLSGLRTRLQQHQQHRALQHPRWLLQRLSDRLARQHQDLQENLQRRLARQRGQLQQQARLLKQASPSLTTTEQRLAQSADDLKRRFQNHLKQRRLQTQKQAELLHAFSPVNTFARGWSVSYQSNGQALKEPLAIDLGETMRTRLHNGWIESIVTDRKPDPKPERQRQQAQADQTNGRQGVSEPLVRYVPDASSSDSDGSGADASSGDAAP